MLQLLRNQAWEVDADGGDPLGRSGPCVRAESKVCVAAPTYMHRRMRNAVTGGAWPASAAAARGDNSTRVDRCGNNVPKVWQ
jgi:hypothetical protein